ncbi:MAG: efflux RND transporter periplasmic adaptor subunit [Bacteroidia bacterium]|nr:efflux RND transporter periplasmic adaptor subunit [Bacteroidia bacterium]
MAVTLSLKSCGAGEESRVSGEQPKEREIIEVVTANGKIQPEVELKISSDVSGEIVELNVKEGDRIKKGDLLCRIKPDIYESALEKMSATVNSTKAGSLNAVAIIEQAKANFLNAEANFNRSKKLFDQNAVSAQEFDAAKAQYESAKANLKAAEESAKGSEFNIKSAEASLREANTNLSKTYIYAPVDGTVSKLNKEKGERVVGTATMEGTEIMRLANLNEMEVSVEVNENDIVRVHLKDITIIEVDAYSDRKFKGIVTEIANSANSTTGLGVDQVTNFTVKIRILQESYKDLITENNPAPFRPGMSAAVEIQTKTVSNALSIPIMAVTTRIDSSKIAKDEPQKSGDLEVKNDNLEKQENKKDELKPEEVVFVVNDNVVKLVKVKTGIQDNNFIQVLSGLTKNDQVVAAPYSAISKELKEGSKVTVVKKEELFTKSFSK